MVRTLLESPVSPRAVWKARGKMRDALLEIASSTRAGQNWSTCPSLYNLIHDVDSATYRHQLTELASSSFNASKGDR